MDKTKLTLADVITLLAAVGYGFIYFLSLNFLTLGEISNSIIKALGIAILLGGLALIAKLLKTVKRNFQISVLSELVVLLAFIGIAFFSFTYYSHYFTVNDKKDQIQTKVAEKIAQEERLFPEYTKYANSRINLHRSTLQTVVRSRNINPQRYHSFGFKSGISDDEQINSKIFALQANLFPSNYVGLQKADSTWLANAKTTTKSWKPIGVVRVVNGIEKNTTDNINQLKTFSAYKDIGEDPAEFPDSALYQVQSLTFDDVKGIFKTKAAPTAISYGTAIFLYLAMLFSYSITKRDSRYPGINRIFGVRKDDNEI